MAFGAVVELGSLDGVTGFRVTGETVSDYAGASLSAAGDVNGDGFEDFIVGAWLTNLNGPNTGATYLVFGKAGGFAPSLSLQTLNGANGFRIMETTPGADAFSVSGGGDYNGDGYDDILIGTRWDNASYRGGAYVVLGKNTAFAANVDPSGLNGTNGFRLVGAIDQGQAGRAVSNAGDVNGDGVDDFLVAAPYADNFNGVTYLVFGRESGFPASIQLSAIDGSNGFRLTGVESGKVSGFSASGGGDINGDGYDDLIIGSPNAFAPEFRMGATYVVYGKASFTAALSLGDLNGANGFTIGGEAARSNSAHSVANAGDVNGDGYDDMIIGAPYA
ncbi:MAG: repeat protein, partial [Caulobacter sp.]|nr:repeat protein [Caulobacter sp.]